MQSQPLEHRIWIHAPIADVWRAWTDSESITQWFAQPVRVEPWEGGAFELSFEPGAPDRHSTRGCKLLEVTPYERLVFEWKGPDDFASFMNQPDPRTQVTVIFEPDAEGTSVHLVHSGWGDGDDWEQARSWHDIAWSDVLEALKRTLEQQTEAHEALEAAAEGELEEGVDLELDLGFDDMRLPPPPRAESRPARRDARPARPAAAPGMAPGAGPPAPPPARGAAERPAAREEAAPPKTAPGKPAAAKGAKPAAKQAAGKKAAKKVAKKKVAAKKAARKKAAKKAPPKRPAKKKPARRKPAAKKAAHKPSPKRAARKKPARRKPVAKRSAARKGARKRPATKRPAARPRSAPRRPARKARRR